VRLVQTIMQGELRQRWLRVDRPTPDTLRLTFQDEGLRKASIEQLDSYARVVGARALNLLAPPPADLPEGLRVVSVRMERSHRLGPLVWLGKVTTYTLDARVLRPPMKGKARSMSRTEPRARYPHQRLDSCAFGRHLVRIIHPATEANVTSFKYPCPSGNAPRGSRARSSKDFDAASPGSQGSGVAAG
jgi:hypothetical protein